MTFPVDFFEHNQQLTEIEFGGNDLLQVYNGQQIKHRLNSTGMYVANTKVGILETWKFNCCKNVTKVVICFYLDYTSYIMKCYWLILKLILFSPAWGIHCGSRQQQQFNGHDRHAGASRKSGYWEGTFICGGLWSHHADQPDKGTLVWLSFHQRGSPAGWQETVYL